MAGRGPGAGKLADRNQLLVRADLPLVNNAGCTHLVVIHSSDRSSWRRDWFSATRIKIIEIGPGRTVQRIERYMGEIRDMFNFSHDILS